MRCTSFCSFKLIVVWLKRPKVSDIWTFIFVLSSFLPHLFRFWFAFVSVVCEGKQNQVKV